MNFTKDNFILTVFFRRFVDFKDKIKYLYHLENAIFCNTNSIELISSVNLFEVHQSYYILNALHRGFIIKIINAEIQVLKKLTISNTCFFFFYIIIKVAYLLYILRENYLEIVTQF